MAVDVDCTGLVRDRAEARRLRIIEAARMLFVNNGFHATGVAQIAKESGIAIGQIYRDFEAKEEIVAAIVATDCFTFLERDCLDRAIAAGDESAVWAWIRQFLSADGKPRTEPLFAEIIAESARNERIAAIFASKRQDVGGSMDAALAFLIPGDAAAVARARLGDLVQTLSLGLMHQRLLQPDFDTKALVDMILGIIAQQVAALRGGGTGTDAVQGPAHA